MAIRDHILSYSVYVGRRFHIGNNQCVNAPQCIFQRAAFITIDILKA